VAHTAADIRKFYQDWPINLQQALSTLSQSALIICRTAVFTSLHYRLDFLSNQHDSLLHRDALHDPQLVPHVVFVVVGLPIVIPHKTLCCGDAHPSGNDGFMLAPQLP